MDFELVSQDIQWGLPEEDKGGDGGVGDILNGNLFSWDKS